MRYRLAAVLCPAVQVNYTALKRVTTIYDCITLCRTSNLIYDQAYTASNTWRGDGVALMLTEMYQAVQCTLHTLQSRAERMLNLLQLQLKAVAIL